MLYEKPKNLKYTDMAIFIDNNIYKEELDYQTINKIYEYLYHLSYMLARKRKFFNKSFYYEEFSIHLATSVYIRLTNKKQFIKNPDGSYQLPKIKSVLNYIKSVLYPEKVIFEQENYYQGLHVEDIDDDTCSNLTGINFLQNSVDDISLFNIDMYFDDLNKTIKEFLKTIPYYKDKILWNNIYVSCLLTILNCLVLSVGEKNKIKCLKYKVGPDSTLLEDIYEKNKRENVILFRLPTSMSNYIFTLCNEIRHIIAQDISIMLNESISCNSNDYLMIKEINGLQEEEMGDF